MSELLAMLSALAASAPVRTAALCLVRILPVGAMTPVFGGDLAPRRLRLMLSLLTAAIAASACAPAPESASSPLGFATAAAAELFVGIVLAVLIRAQFELAGMFGAIADAARGATNGHLYDPVGGLQTSVLSAFALRLTLVAFASSGGLRVMLDGFDRSFASVPPGLAVETNFASALGTARLWSATTDLFITAVQVAAPVLAAALVVDGACALIQRAGKGFEIDGVRTVLKPWLGLIIAATGMSAAVFVSVDGLARGWAAWFD